VKNDDLPNDMQTTNSPEEQHKRITARIDSELDLIGISARYKGRAYLHEAVFLLLCKDENASEAVINQVAARRKSSCSAIIRAMQTAINKAWRISSIEDLQRYYTARVDVKTGVPSPSDFIHYYAGKIRRSM
jgi:hypothetical protein